MREMAGAYWAQATDVAGALVREKGLPWRTAHQIVGILVRFSEERGIRPRDVNACSFWMRRHWSIWGRVSG